MWRNNRPYIAFVGCLFAVFFAPLGPVGLGLGLLGLFVALCCGLDALSDKFGNLMDECERNEKRALGLLSSKEERDYCFFWTQAFSDDIEKHSVWKSLEELRQDQEGERCTNERNN